MIFHQIVNSKEEKNGHIRHDLADGSQRFYRAIYTGVSWPEHPKPNGYFCILGQGREKNPAGRFPLTLLAEDQAPVYQHLFRTLSDDSKLCSCREVFSDISESREGFRDLFWEDPHLKGLFLQQAPFSDNFSLGIQLIRAFVKDKALTIDPGSIVAKQLGTIPESSLGEKPEIDFYAIDALRHTIAAFIRYSSEDYELKPLEFDEDHFFGEPWSIEDFMKHST